MLTAEAIAFVDDVLGLEPEIREALTPADFADARLRILDKGKRLVPLVYNRVQRDLMSSLTGRDLVLKARQHGVSTAIQGKQYQDATTGTATCMTLSKDDDSTQMLRRIAERFYRHDPQQPRRGSDNARLTTYPATDSEVLIATAGNETSGRSATLTHLHGSEAAYWKNAEFIVAGALQAGEPQTVLESTPNGAQGYFYGLCMEALDGNSDWRLHFYPWWWEAGYRLALDAGETLDYTDDEAALATAHTLLPEQIKWRRSKQRELKQLFSQEYPEDPLSCFLRSGYGYFGDLTGVFSAPLDPACDPTHRYVAGLDFAQTVDFTVCGVIDVTTRVEVAHLRINQLPWKTMRGRVIDLCKAWHVSVLQAEKNSMGSTNTEALREEMRAANCHTSVVEFTTTHESKASIMSALHESLHATTGLRLQADPVWTHELNAFIAQQLPSGAWKLAAPDKEHDDTVIGRALAWDVARGGHEMQTARNPIYDED